MIPVVSTPEILCIKQFLQDVQDAKNGGPGRGTSLDMKQGGDGRGRLVRDEDGIQDVWVPES